MLKISYAGCFGLSLRPFRRNLVLKCAMHPEIAKNLLKPFFFWGGVEGRSMSLMLINLKPVISACYDKQHVCTYMQPFSRYTSQ